MMQNDINEININNANNNIIIVSDNDVISSSNKDLIDYSMNQINDNKYYIRNLNGEFLYKDKFDKNIFKEKDNSFYSQKYLGTLSIKKDDKINNLMIKSRFDNFDNENFLNVLLESTCNLPNPLFCENKKKDDEKKEDEVNNLKSASKKYERITFGMSCFLFVACLNNAIKKGMFRQYNEFEHNDTKIKGRIDVSRQVIKNQSIQGKVCYTTREYTTDNVINRMILKTYIVLERENKNLLTNIMASNKDAQKHIIKLKTLIPNIEEYGISDFINKGNSKITNMVYKEYESLRKVCIGILKSKGKYTYDINDSRINGIVIDIEKLWSIYVYKNIIKNIDDELKDEDSNDNDMFAMMNDKNITKHDFVVKLKNKKIIFDTSYSKLFENFDNNKLSSDEKIKYDETIEKINIEAKENNANNIYLIYPVNNKDENANEFYLNKIKKLPLDYNINLFKIPFLVPNCDINYSDFKSKMNNSISLIKKIIISNN